MTKNGWAVAAALVWALTTQAQTVEPDRPDAVLACLTHRTSLPRLPEEARDRTRAGVGVVRVLLTFERAEAAPRVQVLANSATEAMQDEVFDYLKTYRLPCLQAGAHAVISVQEFVFDRDATVQVSVVRSVPGATPAGTACVVMPRNRPDSIMARTENMVAKTLLRIRFDGDGDQPPHIDVLYSNAGARVQQGIRDYVAEYRMPCRKPDDLPFYIEQMHMFTQGAKPSKFKEPIVPLDKFMGWVKGANEMRAFFDFDTMACPFRVTWTLRRPHLPNKARVQSQESTDPNRVEFLHWLGGLELTLDERAAERLFDESMGINIPCGQFKLEPTG